MFRLAVRANATSSLAPSKQPRHGDRVVQAILTSNLSTTTWLQTTNPTLSSLTKHPKATTLETNHDQSRRTSHPAPDSAARPLPPLLRPRDLAAPVRLGFRAQSSINPDESHRLGLEAALAAIAPLSASLPRHISRVCVAALNPSRRILGSE